jgi:hypothetical protein
MPMKSKEADSVPYWDIQCNFVVASGCVHENGLVVLATRRKLVLQQCMCATLFVCCAKTVLVQHVVQCVLSILLVSTKYHTYLPHY